MILHSRWFKLFYCNNDNFALMHRPFNSPTYYYMDMALQWNIVWGKGVHEELRLINTDLTELRHAHFHWD